MKIFSLIFSLFVGSVNCFQKTNKLNLNKFKVNNIYHLEKPKTSLKMINIHEFNGFDIGIPLNLFQNLFTNIHYGYDITTPQATVLQFLIGYYTYGKDRFKDALEYESNKYETRKKYLYEFLLKNREFYSESYNIALGTIILILTFDKNFFNNIPFIILLISSEYYKQIKVDYGYLKSFYVSVMWTVCCIILPCVMHDQNYDIINYPQDYLPCFLSIFASSNLNDIKDINEDKINNINTIPVLLNEEETYFIVLICLALSSLIYGLNDHYIDRPIINSLFELQNAGVSFIPYIMSKKHIKK